MENQTNGNIMHTVLFEGIDKVGKSSTMQALYKLLAYRITCFDRGYLSTYAYDYLRQIKKVKEGKLHETDALVETTSNAMAMCAAINNFGESITVVLVHADSATVAVRMIEANHEPYFQGSREAFEVAFRLAQRTCPDAQFIALDTTGKTAEESAAEIWERLQILWREQNEL